MKQALIYIRMSKLKLSVLFVLLIGIVVSIVALANQGMSSVSELAPHEHRPSSIFLPENGCVPDEVTAVQIAEAVWLSVYGKSIYERTPFRAELLGDTLWAVAGSLPINMLGGVPYIEIQKKDGKVLGIGHGK